MSPENVAKANALLGWALDHPVLASIAIVLLLWGVVSAVRR